MDIQKLADQFYQHALKTAKTKTVKKKAAKLPEKRAEDDEKKYKFNVINSEIVDKRFIINYLNDVKNYLHKISVTLKDDPEDDVIIYGMLDQSEDFIEILIKMIDKSNYLRDRS